MNTDELIMLLQTTYPQLDIYPMGYEFDGQEHFCIMLDYAGTSIYDPTTSTCSRFEVEGGYYGLSPEHAKMMRRHNLHYERTQLSDSFDLQVIMRTIIEEAAKSIGRAQENPSEFLLDLGFEVCNSSGVRVHRLDDPFTREFLLVYDDEGTGISSTFAEIEMTRYTESGDQIGVSLDIKGNDAYAIHM